MQTPTNAYKAIYYLDSACFSRFLSKSKTILNYIQCSKHLILVCDIIALLVILSLIDGQLFNNFSLSHPLPHMFLIILIFVSYYIAWQLLLKIILSSQVDVVESLSGVQFFCDPMDGNPPGSMVHGISQARILELVAISSFRGSSQPRYWTCISVGSYIGRWILHREVT